MSRDYYIRIAIYKRDFTFFFYFSGGRRQCIFAILIKTCNFVILVRDRMRALTREIVIDF